MGQESLEKKEENNSNQEINESYKGGFYMQIATHFAISLLAAVIALSIYVFFIQKKQPQFYSFNLSKLVKQEEIYIMKHPKQNLKKDISAYMESISNYIDAYSSQGIVLVEGASIGKSPYVTDITKGFKYERKQ